MQSLPPEIQARHISKRFGSLAALEGVSLRVAPGSFHALLGENGAGKSTLVKCLMGFQPADTGEVLIDGERKVFSDPKGARSCGLGMVFQHFTLIPSMTVAENLVLARPDLPLFIDWRGERKRLAEFLRSAPFRVDMNAVAANLSAGHKQKVEILKELYLQTRFLILDEPTSMLTPEEAGEVLGHLRKLADQKRLSVLMITHKFKEVMTYSDEVTVLRKGRFAGYGLTGDLSADQMAEMMIGEARSAAVAQRDEEAEPGKPVLSIAGLRAFGDNGVLAVRGVDVAVRAGEIVGIAGVSGNGQRELVEVLAGQRKSSDGTIKVNGRPHHARRNELKREGFFVLPEEPLRNACVPQLTIAENLALRSFDEPPITRGGFLLNKAAMVQLGWELIQRFNVRPPRPDLPIGSLSGGNVQRAVLARELSDDVQVLVAANPCFGLDFKAVDFIHDRLIEARNKGAAVLLISEDLDELLELSDRLFVMTEGRLSPEIKPSAAEASQIGRQMAGHH